MKILLLIFFILAITVIVRADNISSPPPLKEVPAALQHYLKSIYDNLHQLEVVTTTPNGNRFGEKGDMLFLQTGGNHFLEINTNGSQSWSGVQLFIVP